MTFRFLVSFHYHQKTDLQRIINAYDGPCEVFADSGAYSAATLGTTISLTEYAAWLREWNQLLTVKATLDVIGDPVTTARNTRILEDMGLPVLPVFHVGSPWFHLERLCAEYDYVALGGMVPYSKGGSAILRWLVKCFQIARDTGTVFHGFGQTSLSTLRLLPFYSVDSSAWAAGMRYGVITLWDDQTNRFVSIQGGNPAVARANGALLRQHGMDPALVAKAGFAMLSQRTQEQYDHETAMMRGTPALAYLRMGQWLARRHKVPAPEGLGPDDGTCVYLVADRDGGKIVTAARHAREAR